MADKVRKDAFNIDTTSLKGKTAGGSYGSNEQAMLEEIKNLLIKLIENGKGS